MNWRDLWRGFLPLFLSLCIAQLIQQADMVMMSRLGGAAPAAYLGLMRVAVLDSMVLMAMGSVTSVVVAQARREGRPEQAVRPVLGIALIFGVIVAVLGLLCYGQFAAWLVGEGELSRLVGRAVLWYALAAPFRFLVNAATFILHALGEGRVVVQTKLAEFIFRSSLGYCLIFLGGFGFVGCFVAGLVTAILACGWLLLNVSRHVSGGPCWPSRAWAANFLRKAAWETQRILSSQLFALVSFTLFSSEYFMPVEISRLNAYAAGSTLTLFIFTPYLALMRSLAFLLTGRSGDERRPFLKRLCCAGVPLAILFSTLLFWGSDWLGFAVYGQSGPWWSSLLRLVAISMPIRFVNNLMRAVLQSGQKFSVVSATDSVAMWLFGLPIMVAGLYCGNATIFYGYIIIPEIVCSVLYSISLRSEIWGRFRLSSMV